MRKQSTIQNITYTNNNTREYHRTYRLVFCFFRLFFFSFFNQRKNFHYYFFIGHSALALDLSFGTRPNGWHTYHRFALLLFYRWSEQERKAFFFFHLYVYKLQTVLSSSLFNCFFVVFWLLPFVCQIARCWTINWIEATFDFIYFSIACACIVTFWIFLHHFLLLSIQAKYSLVCMDDNVGGF